jgi:uncharacterized Rmd1/YagE family protein
MTKAQREDAGLPRLTAYATAEGYRMKLLQAFLKREHGCGVVRVFDDAVYAVRLLPVRVLTVGRGDLQGRLPLYRSTTFRCFLAMEQGPKSEAVRR